MSPEIEIHDDARTDLSDIWFYSLSHWGKAQADRYARQILAQISGLADNPELGRPRPELGAGRRSLICGRHIVFYHLTPALIRVQRVLHASRDPSRHL